MCDNTVCWTEYLINFQIIVKKFSGKGQISEKNVQDAVEEIKIALLDADVNLRVVRRFINSTLEEAVGDKVLNL